MRCAGVTKLQAQLAELRKPQHCRLPPTAPPQQDPAQARQAPAPAQLALGSLVDFEEHEADGPTHLTDLAEVRMRWQPSQLLTGGMERARAARLPRAAWQELAQAAITLCMRLQTEWLR